MIPLSQLPLPSAYSQCKTVSPQLGGTLRAQGRTWPNGEAGIVVFFYARLVSSWGENK